MMVDWLGGYSSRWRVFEVDPDTWADREEIAGVRSVSVRRDGGDSVPLLETATMEIDGDWPDSERWCRISMIADQGGSREKVEVATLLFQQSKDSRSYGSSKRTCNGWSVLKTASDRLMSRGSYAPRGSDGAAYAASLLRECVPAPVTVEGGFELVEHFVFDIGSSYLDAAWTILNAGGWCMQIGGDGAVSVRQMPSEPSLDLDAAHAALLMPGVTRSSDTSGVPNRYYAIDGVSVEIATNNDPASPVSYASRGRWVDMIDTSPVRVGGETLQTYAARRLSEVSVATRDVSYIREWWPGVVPYSVVRGSMASIGLDGDMRVVSQTLNCGCGVTVSETARQEVSLI